MVKACLFLFFRSSISSITEAYIFSSSSNHTYGRSGLREVKVGRHDPRPPRPTIHDQPNLSIPNREDDLRKSIGII